MGHEYRRRSTAPVRMPTVDTDRPVHVRTSTSTAIGKPTCDHWSYQHQAHPAPHPQIRTLSVPSKALQDRRFASAHHLGVKGSQVEILSSRRVAPHHSPRVMGCLPASVS